MLWNAFRSLQILPCMNSLYLLLDIGTVFFPIVLSFDRRVHYVSSWKTVALSSIIIGIPFIIWDVIFTEQGIWGFNPDYLTGIYLGNLPLEEVLFFIVVPFACTFIYECCKYYMRSRSHNALNRFVQLAIPLYAIVLVLLEPVGTYTAVVTATAALTLVAWLFNQKFVQIGIAFIISVVPFMIVNGVLTGSSTPEPIVWYNEAHKVTTRIFTIPMEDLLYSFTLIVSVILVHEKLAKRVQK